jgi:hypothetical protein
MGLELPLRDKIMPPSRELDMKETASTSHPKDFQPADSPIKYEMKCFACGAPVKWYQDICDSCQKLTDLHCT